MGTPQGDRAAIPGYMGYIPAKRAENVFSSTFNRTLMDCKVATHNHRPQSSGRFRQTTRTKGGDRPVERFAGQFTTREIDAAEDARGGLTTQPGRRALSARMALGVTAQTLRGEAARLTSRGRTLTQSWDYRDQNERPHGMMRSGISGYQGHVPLWQKEVDFFYKSEVGKAPARRWEGGDAASQLMQTSRGNTAGTLEASRFRGETFSRPRTPHSARG